MAVIAEIDYLTYAATCKDGKRLLELPEHIQQNIVKYCDDENLIVNQKFHPDSIAQNLKKWNKHDFLKFINLDREVTDELLNRYSDDEIEESINNNFNYFGKQDGYYYLLILGG